MMELEEDIVAKALFLQNVTKLYSGASPQLMSYFGSRFTRTLKEFGVRSFTCPCCYCPFSLENTSIRTITRRHLKLLRRYGHVKGRNVHHFTPKQCRSYVVAHCKVCHRSTVVGGHSATRLELTAYSDTPLHSMSTPMTKIQYAVQKKRYTEGESTARHGLKAALRQTQQFRSQQAGTSPMLTEFLTSLQ